MPTTHDPGRTCTKCKEYKTHEFFNKNSGLRCGLESWCKACIKASVYAGRARDPEATKRKNRDYWLRKNYNITLLQYEEMVEEQGGRCAACGCEPAEAGRWGEFHVDHCHDTGVVRGILCSNCNVCLGYAKNDPDRLRALARYISTRK